MFFQNWSLFILPLWGSGRHFNKYIIIHFIIRILFVYIVISMQCQLIHGCIVGVSHAWLIAELKSHGKHCVLKGENETLDYSNSKIIKHKRGLQHLLCENGSWEWLHNLSSECFCGVSFQLPCGHLCVWVVVFVVYEAVCDCISNRVFVSACNTLLVWGDSSIWTITALLQCEGSLFFMSMMRAAACRCQIQRLG